MFKVLIFARRRTGLDREQLIAAYEGAHMELTDRLVDQGVIPALRDYRRNYLVHRDPLNVGPDLEFDVVTAAWFEDRAAFEANRAGLADPEVAAEIQADLSSFLGLESVRYVVVEEFQGHGSGRSA